MTCRKGPKEETTMNKVHREPHQLSPLSEDLVPHPLDPSPPPGNLATSESVLTTSTFTDITDFSEDDVTIVERDDASVEDSMDDDTLT